MFLISETRPDKGESFCVIIHEMVPLTDIFTWKVYIELPSELHPYLPLSHLQTCLHAIAIRVSPLFTLIWPYRYVYIELPSEFHPYSPLSGLTDIFTCNHHHSFALICPYLALQTYLHAIAIIVSPLFALIWPYRYVYIEWPSEFHPYSPLSHLQICLH